MSTGIGGVGGEKRGEGGISGSVEGGVCFHQYHSRKQVTTQQLTWVIRGERVRKGRAIKVWTGL